MPSAAGSLISVAKFGFRVQADMTVLEKCHAVPKCDATKGMVKPYTSKWTVLATARTATKTSVILSVILSVKCTATEALEA